MLFANDELTEEEKSAVQKFKDKAQQFWALFTDLDNAKDLVAKLPPEKQQEYKDLMERGVSLRGTIEKITGAIDYAAQKYQDFKDWFSSTFGLSGDEAREHIQGLGILPLLAIGGAVAIAAASVAIGKWVSEAQEEKRLLEEIKRLEDKGVSTEKAYSLATSLRTPGFFETFAGSAGKWIVIAAVGIGIIYFWPKLSRRA